MSSSSGSDAEDPVKIGDKIHQFEHAEREKVQKEEKDRKKAIFQRKLSKFTPPPPEEKPRTPSEVSKLAQKFAELNESEEVQREKARRKEEFERKRSGFSSGSPEQLQQPDEEEGKNRLQKMRLMFEDRDAALAQAEDEMLRKRQEEEEAEQRRKDFEDKSSMFKKLSASHDR